MQAKNIEECGSYAIAEMEDNQNEEYIMQAITHA